MTRPSFPLLALLLAALTLVSATPVRAASANKASDKANDPIAAPGPAPDATPDGELRKLEELISSFRQRNAERYAIHTPKGIDEGRYIRIGGIDQWITVRGQNRDNPVILLLHGGPGDVTTPYSYPLFLEWEKAYTVVQWDQRGGGRTLRNTDPKTITIERIVGDGIELAERLLKDLRQKKLILVGHSWGSFLGARMAKARPDLFYAFVGTGQVENTAKANRVGYDGLLARAKAVENAEAVTELTAIGPPPYSDFKRWPVLRKWGNRIEGSDRFIGGTLGFALAAPGYTPTDVIDWINGQDVSGRALFNAITDVDPQSFHGEFRTPVFVIQGEYDFTTPTALAREFVESIQAPQKAFAIIPDTGHFAMFMKPEAFLAELTQRVAPLLPRS
jgi:pimeloyl-ACP methyl ester carboxylesterase